MKREQRARIGENNHSRAFVTVVVRGVKVQYTVYVARLGSAENGAFRRYPDATHVKVTRERWSRR
jgi:hypothetical protein